MSRCTPGGSFTPARTAVPALVRAASIGVGPSKNVTHPFGVPAPGGSTATLAVKDISCPDVTVALDAAIVMFVGARQTINGVGGVALRPKSELPAYSAVRTCVPTFGYQKFIVATPLTSVALASQWSPSLKTTAPRVTGTPAGLVTIAVNVNCWR